VVACCSTAATTGFVRGHTPGLQSRPTTGGSIEIPTTDAHVCANGPMRRATSKSCRTPLTRHLTRQKHIKPPRTHLRRNMTPSSHRNMLLIRPWWYNTLRPPHRPKVGGHWGSAKNTQPHEAAAAAGSRLWLCTLLLPAALRFTSSLANRAMKKCSLARGAWS
jgi:hypothetical protein